jgi:hypothetical protein
MFASRHPPHRLDECRPCLPLLSEHASPFSRHLVEPAAPLVGLLDPRAPNPPAFLEAIEQRVKESMWNMSWPSEPVWISLLSSSCRGRASSSERMTSSADPFFSSRSTACVSIPVINRYYRDRCHESIGAPSSCRSCRSCGSQTRGSRSSSERWKWIRLGIGTEYQIASNALVSAVPEPGTLTLLGICLAGAAVGAGQRLCELRSRLVTVVR